MRLPYRMDVKYLLRVPRQVKFCEMPLTKKKKEEEKNKEKKKRSRRGKEKEDKEGQKSGYSISHLEPT